MLRFLFWNINRKPLQAMIRNLVDQHDVDVLILAECQIPPAQLLPALNTRSDHTFCKTSSACEGLEIYSRFMPDLILPRLERRRWTIRRLTLPAREEILLVAVHLVSKLHWSDESQVHECQQLADHVREVERTVGHDRTILVGDLNMAPFERGVVAAAGLSAVMTRSTAAKGTRMVEGVEYPFFYNPMWGRLGDESPGPAGTYYRTPPHHIGYYWYMFDQVLVRPALMKSFRNEDLHVLTTDGTQPLVTKRGLPDKGKSDHLPITFALRL